ncbi:MAG TPA: hypothetical protein VK848_03185 [Acidimicrobiia bacterium]|nr:hypothetical protein [Acidimicrobiia bacterium]
MLAGRFTPSPSQVRLADAVDAQFVGPGGKVETARAGAALPEGTVIRTGPSGRATVGDETLGPDSAAVVSGGHLRPLQASARPGPSAGVGPGPQAAGSAGQGRRGGPKPGRASAAAPQSPPAGALTPTSKPAQPVEPQARPAPVTLRLTAVRRPGAVALEWSRYPGPAFSGYAVLRVSGTSGPRYPRNAIRFTGDVADTTFSDRGAPSSPLRYRVVALDDQGQVVAASEVVTVSPA